MPVSQRVDAPFRSVSSCSPYNMGNEPGGYFMDGRPPFSVNGVEFLRPNNFIFFSPFSFLHSNIVEYYMLDQLMRKKTSVFHP